MSYLVGIDIGGTFTDCAIVDRAGKLLTTKVPSTPPDFSRGMLDALGAGAQALGVSLDRFCRDIAFLSHGTTVGTNTIIQKRGAKVGLITTRGHEDAIHIMRGSRGYGGRDIRKVVHFPETSKPAPIVPKRLIRGVSERVDCFGEIVVSLNETEAEAAIHSLLAEGVQAIAICFLWSFRNPAHEQRVKNLVEKISKDVFVTCSVDIAPKWGEYERVTATALNAYLGPVMSGYLQKLDSSLKDLGYRHGLQITQCGGGTVPVGRAGEAPLLTLDSGPVSSVTASMFLGAAMREKNVITTDSGGKMKLDFSSAAKAIQDLGKKINMDAMECAAGICRIVELQMADVIRKVTVEKGFDPRDFVLFAFGGAGPAHAGVFARELGVRKVIVPQRKAASTWCAFGAAAADVLHIFEHTEIMPTPVGADRINKVLDALQSQAKKRMANEGIAAGRQRFEFSLDVRHKGQINEVEVLLPWSRLPADFELRLRKMFVERYEQLYGRGSALAGAQLEFVVSRLRARALTPQPKLVFSKKSSKSIAKSGIRKKRDIYWPDLRKHRATPVFDGEKLISGNQVKGPAIVETADTTVVVHPGTTLRLDALGNFEISFR